VHAFELYDFVQFVSDRPGDYTLSDGRFVQLVHTVDKRMARALHQFSAFDSSIVLRDRTSSDVRDRGPSAADFVEVGPGRGSLPFGANCCTQRGWDDKVSSVDRHALKMEQRLLAEQYLTGSHCKWAMVTFGKVESTLHDDDSIPRDDCVPPVILEAFNWCAAAAPEPVDFSVYTFCHGYSGK